MCRKHIAVGPSIMSETKRLGFATLSQVQVTPQLMLPSAQMSPTTDESDALIEVSEIMEEKKSVSRS